MANPSKLEALLARELRETNLDALIEAITQELQSSPTGQDQPRLIRFVIRAVLVDFQSRERVLERLDSETQRTMEARIKPPMLDLLHLQDPLPPDDLVKRLEYLVNGYLRWLTDIGAPA